MFKTELKTGLEVGLKNYVSSLKYVFVALGVMLIALILGTQTMVDRSVKEIKTMVAAIGETTASSDLSFDDVGKSFKDTFDSAKHNMSVAVITGIEEPQEVEKSVSEAIGDLITNYITYLGNVLGYVAAALTGIIMAVILFLVIFLIVTMLGNTVITMFGRNDIHEDHAARIFLEQLARCLIIIMWLGINYGICCLNVKIGLVIAALFPLVYCYIALFNIWLTAGDGRRPKYAIFVKFRTVIILLIGFLAEIIAGIIFAAILYLLFGMAIAAVFAISFIVLAASNVNINAYAFFFGMPEVRIALGEVVETAAADAETAAAPQITLEPVKESSVSEEVKKEEPEAVENKAEESKAEETKTEEAKAEETKTEEPKAEEVKDEEPKAEEAEPEEPKAEEVKDEEAKAEEPKPEEPKAEEAEPEEAKAEESKAEESKAEESKAEEAKPEEPKAEEGRAKAAAAAAGEVSGTIKIDIEE